MVKSLDTIFNPNLFPKDHSSVTDYGKEELKFLLDHYQAMDVENSDILTDTDRYFRDFLPFKHHAKLHCHFGFCECVTVNPAGDCPNFGVLGNLALCVPLNSASCETGFSSQKLAKPKPRNRLDEDTSAYNEYPSKWTAFHFI